MRRIITLLTLCMPLSALAIESIESDSLTPPAEGDSGHVEAAYGGRSGNSSYDAFTGGGRLDYRADRTLMFLTGDYTKVSANGAQAANTGWIHGGFIDEYQHGLAAEAYIDHLQDDQRQLANRTQLGGGMRFTLDQISNFRSLYMGLGALHEWQAQSGIDNDYWRANSYISYLRRLTPQATLLLSLQYQPRTSDWSNYLIEDVAEVGVTLSPMLSLQVGLRHEYDSWVANPVIRHNDTLYETSLRLRY